jgi:hypothetical protein
MATTATGIAWFEERDVYSDFSLVVTAIKGFPGMLGMAPRLVPLLTGPEINGAMVDPLLIARQPSRRSSGASRPSRSPPR